MNPYLQPLMSDWQPMEIAPRVGPVWVKAQGRDNTTFQVWAYWSDYGWSATLMEGGAPKPIAIQALCWLPLKITTQAVSAVIKEGGLGGCGLY